MKLKSVLLGNFLDHKYVRGGVCPQLCCSPKTSCRVHQSDSVFHWSSKTGLLTKKCLWVWTCFDLHMWCVGDAAAVTPERLEFHWETEAGVCWLRLPVRRTGQGSPGFYQLAGVDGAGFRTEVKRLEEARRRSKHLTQQRSWGCERLLRRLSPVWTRWSWTSTRINLQSEHLDRGGPVGRGHVRPVLPGRPDPPQPL